MQRKNWIWIFAVLLLSACLLAAGCSQVAPSQGNRQNQAGAGPAGGSGTMGIITEVSETSVTIALMPSGQMGQRPGGQQPQGTPPAEAGQKPDGTPPPDGAKQQPNGSMPPMNAPDTANWEKKTYAIDDKTAITQGQGGESKALTAADLKTGDSVMVTERSGKAGTADSVTVMRGMGRPGGQPGQSADN